VNFLGAFVGVQESCARGKHRMPRWMHKNAASSQSETFKYIILVLYRAFLRSGHCHDKNDTRNILWLVPKLLQRRQTSDSTLAFWKFNLHPGTSAVAVLRHPPGAEEDGEGDAPALATGIWASSFCDWIEIVIMWRSDKEKLLGELVPHGGANTRRGALKQTACPQRYEPQ
jgi:hypothetical protein